MSLKYKVMDAIYGGPVMRFFHACADYLPNILQEPSRHCDVGHNKSHHLKIAMGIARSFQSAEIVYYDNSKPAEEGDINSENISAFKSGLSFAWLKKLFARPENPKIKRRPLSLPSNLIITNKPQGVFNSATYAFCGHEFDGEGLERNLAEIYDLLVPGSGVCFTDYVAKGIPVEAFGKLFSTRNEKNALENEADCFERHTQYTPESLSELFVKKGFDIVDDFPEVEYVNIDGKEYPKTALWVLKKPLSLEVLV